MFSAFFIILPLAFFVALGWILKRKWVKPEAQQGINFFLMNFSIPALLFHLVQPNDFVSFLQWKFLSCIFIGLGTIFILAMLVGLIFQRNYMAALFSGLNASMLNSALIGIPVLLALLSNQASAPLALINFVVSAIYFPIAFILIEFGQSHSGSNLFLAIINVLKRIVTNPVIMSVPLGLVASYYRIPIPHAINTFITMLANIASPLALLMVGMSLSFNNGSWGINVIWLSFLKTIGLPMLVLGLALWLGLNQIAAICAVVGCAVPSSKTIFLISQKYGNSRIQAQTTTVIALSTILAIVTLPMFIVISSHFWPNAVIQL